MLLKVFNNEWRMSPYLVTVNPHLHPLTHSGSLVSARQGSARIATNLKNLGSDLLSLFFDTFPRLPCQFVQECLRTRPLHHSVGTALRLVLWLKRLYGRTWAWYPGDRVISSIKDSLWSVTGFSSPSYFVIFKQFVKICNSRQRFQKWKNETVNLSSNIYRFTEIYIFDVNSSTEEDIEVMHQSFDLIYKQ